MLLTIRPMMSLAPMPMGARASSALRSLFVRPQRAGADASVFYVRLVQTAEAQRLAQSVRHQTQPLGDLRHRQAFIQQSLRLRQHRWQQDPGAAPTGFFEKTGHSFFAIQLDVALDADPADAKGTAYLRLLDIPVDIQLAGDHAK